MIETLRRVSHLSHSMHVLKKCHIVVSQPTWVSGIMPLNRWCLQNHNLLTTFLWTNCVWKTFQTASAYKEDFKATSTPPNKQFCLLIKIVWKDQLFFVAAYQTHIYSERLWSWHGIDEGFMSAQEHTLPIYIWFWYSTMQNNISIQDDSIT